MAAYIITFEMNDTTRLNSFKAKMRELYSGICPINPYSWAITSDKTAIEIRDELKPFTQTGDRLFVIRSGTAAAWLNSYGKDHDEWLKKYL